ncbi:MFS general substrate transporter [Punctularia strigosozonata HHB-11173 SS5]|uniref:MFS general substrate transporter n=1 Tax=Punctularia strigosozonata (strain HHB-11173) TaxID=741275 RepID=UPI000441840B|nr:MFS general substrate transporter [Punctularia strigosozonata HHB-11173 SS5]EIN14350.1 MFS general substrate transporter [Punctularia strigosozonata HHB-11173 SS5]
MDELAEHGPRAPPVITSKVRSAKGEEDVDPNKVVWTEGESDNPQNWSTRYRWCLTYLAITMSLNSTFASAAPAPAVRFIAADFHTSAEVSQLVTSIFLFGYCIGPLLWGPGSEMFGRRPIFIITNTGYVLFTIGQALAPNMATLLITRFFAGFFGVAATTNVPGMMSDIWTAKARGQSAVAVIGTIFQGPVLGGIIGSFIAESSLGWRFIFWTIVIFGGAASILAYFAIPETYHPILLKRKAQKLRQEDPLNNRNLYADHEREDNTLKGILRRTILRPFIILFEDPIMQLITAYMAFLYGIIYGLLDAFPIVFVDKRHLSLRENGLMFVGLGIGIMIGAFMSLLSMRHIGKLAEKWRGSPPPEQRLRGAMIAGPCLAISCFWLGWSGNFSSVPWYVPDLAVVLTGSSIILSFISLIVNTYLVYSASALSATTTVRSGVAAAFPLFTTQVNPCHGPSFSQLGVGWAGTLLGLVALMLTPGPFLFYKYGARIRRRSRFAPCLDLKIAEELEAEERKAGSEKPSNAI